MNKIIESLLTEWKGKTIANNDSFFIELQQTIEKAYTQGQKDMEKNIGMLRQWLNEKPVDRLVTNEDLLVRLKIK